jgi:hypothetical protein
LIREALDGGFPISDDRVARLISLVDHGRLRQDRGEIRDDINVGALSDSIRRRRRSPSCTPTRSLG